MVQKKGNADSTQGGIYRLKKQRSQTTLSTHPDRTNRRGCCVQYHNLCTKRETFSSFLSRCQSARQWSIQVNVLHKCSVFAAIPEKIGEVLAGDIAFKLRLADFVLALSNVLDFLCKAGLQVVGGQTKDAANLGRNPG